MIVQKQVGAYRLLVSIQPPDVVPGTAKVTVFVEQGRLTSIGARPIYFRSGDKGAPMYDQLTPVDNRYEGDLWLMDSGSSSVELQLNGPDGQQTVVVPVMSVATAVRDMPAGTGVALALMGLLLVAMMITIIGASNADGVSLPGAVDVSKLRRRRVVGIVSGAVVMALVLTGWRTWWTSEAEIYQTEQLYRPMPIQTSLALANDGTTKLVIRADTSTFDGSGTVRRRSRLSTRRLLSFIIPDHGKLMHTFLVRLPGLDAFAHLHPARQDSLTFTTNLPALPAGKYLLYSDIVYRSGFAETLTDTIAIPAPATAAPPVALTDRDDSWLITKAIGVAADTKTPLRLDQDMAVCGKPGASATLADGSSMIWMDKPAPTLDAGQLYTLKFAVADEQGRATSLEPYLGMSGHAVVLRQDGTVYIHLHPVGTYSMAAEGSLVGRIADTARTFRYPDANRFRDSIDRYVARLNALPDAERSPLLMAGMPGMRHAMKTNNMVEFPYAFPRAGQYRLFIQVKRKGRVLTGVFDTVVKEPLL